MVDNIKIYILLLIYITFKLIYTFKNNDISFFLLYFILNVEINNNIIALLIKTQSNLVVWPNLEPELIQFWPDQNTSTFK